VRWRIYYGDGETFSDRDGSPFDARTYDVQVIAVESSLEERGFRLVHKKDFYRWQRDEWYGMDEAGLWDYIMLSTGPKCIFVGRTIKNDEYWLVLRRAKAEGLG
jgi:hypothetical protein